MEVARSGDESMVSPAHVRGKKRPPSPSTPPSDGADSSKSAASDEDDNGWAISDDEEGDEEGEYRPFAVDEFPRVSSDDDEQSIAVYMTPEISRRGPSPLMRLPAFKPANAKLGISPRYKLSDESEIIFKSVEPIDCLNGFGCGAATLVQFFDLKIAGYRHAHPGCAKIFGFFAARDRIDSLRNYVYRHDIDNYEAVTVNPKTGTARLSLTSPARGISMRSQVLFEFKLYICTEDPPEDGPKCDTLIEGCAEIWDFHKTVSFFENRRLYGEKCALDMKYAVLINAVQAFVNVEILRAPDCGLNLNLYAKTSGYRDVICLYRGVAKVGWRMNSVVAVEIRSYLDLRIEGTPKDDGFPPKRLPCCEWGDNFDWCYHGTVDKVVNLDEFTLISVKITWGHVD